MKNLSAEEIVALATASAIKISKETPKDELMLVSDFFTMVGASLMAIADRNALDESDSKKT
ncbi:MAG: hypothetical protein FWD58_10920 [Firmicutes bacterium]|nr:hypothetical protein [Bacillota bacterium]